MTRFSSMEDALMTYCEEHNVKGCGCCNKVVGECDFGDCISTATHELPLLDKCGKVGEVRPSCARHVPLMRQGAAYGYEKETVL